MSRMIEVRRSDSRYETQQPGITTWHCFSSGSHYDPANTHFGSMIALDEHVLTPGAEFARHAHRGVDLVSWVLAGTLRHEDGAGQVELIEAGTMLRQSAGSGLEHTEGNASATQPLRFVQLWLISEVAAGQQHGAPPMLAGGGTVTVIAPAHPVELASAQYLHLFITRGSVDTLGHTLRAGDSARIRDEQVSIVGDGEAIVWRSSAEPPGGPSRSIIVDG
jgi:quercetin 2,3-dioxygenase